MPENILSVREMRKEDIDLFIQYWLDAESAFIERMGVDINKIPHKDEWIEILTEQLNHPLEEKKSYFIIWQIDNVAVGHSNINKIIFGQEAYMHLHMWNSGLRKKGHGTTFIKMTLPWYFEKYHLQSLYCEPYALNPAPNKIMEKAGFEFVKEYITIPGRFNFEQPVKLWKMSYDRFKQVSNL